MAGEKLAIVAAPTAFKETLSPVAAARVIARALRGHRVTEIPVADGGDGTLECLHAALGGRVRHATVTGPLGRPVRAPFLLAGRTAVHLVVTPLITHVEPNRSPTLSEAADLIGFWQALFDG